MKHFSSWYSNIVQRDVHLPIVYIILSRTLLAAIKRWKTLLWPSTLWKQPIIETDSIQQSMRQWIDFVSFQNQSCVHNKNTYKYGLSISFKTFYPDFCGWGRNKGESVKNLQKRCILLGIFRMPNMPSERDAFLQL